MFYPSMALPAHCTKHVRLLHYPFLSHTFHLLQLDDGQTNGTALWLGAQCLSLYMASLPKLSARSFLHSGKRPRVVELGSGIGLSALAMSSLGFDVLATDMSDVVSTVLSQNIAQNTATVPADSGHIEIRELDWMVPPDEWTWDNDTFVASSSRLPSDADSTKESLRPPFDLIISSDTVYSSALVLPLLRSLHALSSTSSRAPPIYLCIERRDPSLIDSTLRDAKDTWGFQVERIPHKKVLKAMEKGGIKWAKEDWDGVELWKLVLVQR